MKQTIKLTQGAYCFLKKKYASILCKCSLAAVCCLFAAAPALALEDIPAPGSSFTVNTDMEFINKGNLSYGKISSAEGYTLTLENTNIEASDIDLEGIDVNAVDSSIISGDVLRINKTTLANSSLISEKNLIFGSSLTLVAGNNSLISQGKDIYLGYGVELLPGATLEIRAADEVAATGPNFKINSLFADYATLKNDIYLENGSFVTKNDNSINIFMGPVSFTQMNTDMGKLWAMDNITVTGGKFDVQTANFEKNISFTDTSVSLGQFTAPEFTQSGGSLEVGADAANKVSGAFTLNDTDAVIGNLKVSGKTSVSGGSIKADALTLAETSLTNTQAAVAKLALSGSLSLFDKTTLETAADGLGQNALAINDSTLKLTGDFTSSKLFLNNGTLISDSAIRIDIPEFELKSSKIAGHTLTMQDISSSGQSFLEAENNLTVGNIKIAAGSLGMAAQAADGIINGGNLSFGSNASATLTASKSEFKAIAGEGLLTAQNLHVKEDLQLTNGSLKLSGKNIVGQNLELVSITGAVDDLTVLGGTALQDSSITGSNFSLKDITASGQSRLHADHDIHLGNTMVSSGRFVLESENGDEFITGETLQLQSGAIVGLVSGKSSFANIQGVGSLSAHNLEIRHDLNLNIGSLSLTGQSLIEGNMSLAAINASVEDLTVKGGTDLVGTTFIGRELSLNGAKLDSESSIEAQNLTTSGDIVLANNAELLAGTLNMGDAHLVLDAAPGGRAIAAVAKFNSGDLTVDANSLVSIGTNLPDWVNMGMDGHKASAALGLWTPFQLSSGAQAAVGTGAMSRQRAAGGNQIYFASDSLLITNANVASKNGAGAISAQSRSDANIEAGAKLHILHAEKDGLYRVLGENINVHYNGDAWEGKNVRTDSALIQLERLGGDKLGWFQAKVPGSDVTLPDLTPPIGPGIDDAGNKGQIPKPPTPGLPSEPSTPPAQPTPPSQPETPPVQPTPPSQPDTPPSEPDTPDQPDKPNPPSEPDTPSEPGSPNPPSQPDNPPSKPDTPDEPVKPDMPDEPDQPTQPDEPGEPDTPDEPAEPDTPVEPDEPEQVYTPGQIFLGQSTNFWYIGHDARLAAKTIESACRIFALGAVPELTMAANQAGIGAMAGRTGVNSGTGSQAVNADGEIIENNGEVWHGFALWVTPLYKSVNGYSLSSGLWRTDINGGLGGVAIGADYTFENALRLGLSFNIGGGYAHGNGELADTTNNMSFWGIGAYASWNWQNLDLAADVAFTSTYNKLKQELPDGMTMDDLKSDITARAISAGFELGWTLETDWLNIRPHAGARYTCIYHDKYDVNSGGTVLEGKAKTQNVWTFPLGISFQKDFELNNSWYFKPVLDLAVIPAAGDRQAKTEVRFTGTDTWIDLKDQFMDDITYRGSLGLEFGSDNLAFGINYSMQAGMKTDSQTIMGTFVYTF